MDAKTGSGARLLDRELGILAFNERVLAQAEDESVPLLERLRFLTIVSSNLDELFEIRVAEFKELLLAGRGDGAALRRSLAAIHERARRLVSRQYELLNAAILPQLAVHGVVVHTRLDWTDAQREWAGKVFEAEIEPLLTPIALDPAHPFPRILNKSLNFIVELQGQDAFGRRAGVAIVQAPRALPRILRVPPDVSGAPYGVMPLTSIVQGFVDHLFPGLTVRSVHQFRLTRNSDLFVDDEEVTDLRAALQGELVQRQYGDEVRLEVSAGTSDALVARLLREFELEEQDCYRVDGPVNLVRLQQVIDLVDLPELKYPPFEPSVPAVLREKDLFAAIRKHDILVHHPYESFAPVMEFLVSAARDPRVVAIKQTVYRTGADSALMQALIDAAHAGKEVTVVVELMARFDEETNINWAAKLEQAGAHVVYGVVGHKTHAKMAMVLRREAAKGATVLRRYAHLGTGNYHPRTARLYEDFGLFTANEDICADVHEVFRRLTGLGQRGTLRLLTQAPFSLHEMLLASIRREAANARAGKKAYLAAKVNALLEPTVIDALYEASAAGVRIDLIVRGVCALRPGVPGLSENIAVRSVVGRFLEHSRVFYFLNGGRKDVWLSSADWMDRNLFRRVEIAFPVRERKLKERVIEEAIDVHLRDNVNAWVMDGDGNYRRKRRRAKPFASQAALLARLAGAPADPV
ncbi:MAG: polyphosphate kinase 1 [Burkholderiaceae bacterium]|nr:polyphosphate kinase 1 [Burkholderiaceae bacterium]